VVVPEPEPELPSEEEDDEGVCVDDEECLINTGLHDSCANAAELYCESDNENVRA
jgi:hypothetical protein